MVDVVELLDHWHAGRPKTVIAESLGVNRETVGKYVAPAIAAGITRGGPRLSRAEWAELVEGWFPKLIDPQARSLTRVGVRVLRRVPARLVPDNLKTGVTRPDLYDPNSSGGDIS